MFDIGFSEVLLIFVIALVVLGPEKLPRLASQVGRWIGRARAMARQFREQLEEEVNLEQVRRAHETKPQKPKEEAAPATPGSSTTGAPEGNTASSGTSADIGSSGTHGAADHPPGAGGDVTQSESSSAATPYTANTTGVEAGPAGGHGYNGPDPADFRADTFSHAHPTNEYGANPHTANGGVDAPTASEANVAAAQPEPPTEAQQRAAKPEAYASNTTPSATEQADTHRHS
jgi:sec-independent protein translocase protein TatB